MNGRDIISFSQGTVTSKVDTDRNNRFSLSSHLFPRYAFIRDVGNYLYNVVVRRQRMTKGCHAGMQFDNI